NVDGIYDGNPSDPSSHIIPEITSKTRVELSKYIQPAKSSFGRGGMLTKYSIARKVAQEGVEVIIANGKCDNILTDLLIEGKPVLCTRFLPTERPTSSVKKWIAHSESFAKGEVYINRQAVQKLCSNHAVSLLPIGVTEIKGEFEKDDIVKICNPEGRQIGVGKIYCDSTKARTLIGQQMAKPLIHYDYLYLDQEVES
ncbi:MAG: glutamate 5-kinase, partial [Porphyromonadaceae bacterium]|nr:glutamate 5-kinase [Porphyromonadaceae bacterium]